MQYNGNSDFCSVVTPMPPTIPCFENSSQMLAATLLVKKRDGHALSDDEIRFLVNGYCSGEVADYQMSALAMAICLRGMNDREIATLTAAMRDSGDSLPRETGSERPRVDKHSSGGLGDKVSLILAPLLAACGVDVPMISGRGLGLTGGTLDKLESIHGFRTQLSTDESNRVLAEAGVFIAGATERIAPADRKLYALRDVTGTVESIPLITSSILSKKLAANLDALVMDVKVGRGAFMKTEAHAEQLATTIVNVGSRAGLHTTAILSDMDQPLGSAIGNAIEINEAIEVLRGEGPTEVRELTIELCVDLLVQSKVTATREEAFRRLTGALDRGDAMQRFECMVRAQGGTLNFPLALAPPRDIVADKAGFVASCDCQIIGQSLVMMGAGRRRKEDAIDHRVGIAIHVRVGDHIEKGQPIMTLHHSSKSIRDDTDHLKMAIKIADQVVDSRPIILHRL
jgi:pyrimidine-nucleoside phosphorylase